MYGSEKVKNVTAYIKLMMDKGFYNQRADTVMFC